MAHPFLLGYAMNKLTIAVSAILTGMFAHPAVAQDESGDRGTERENVGNDRRAPKLRLYLSSGFSYATRNGGGTDRTNYYRLPLGAQLSKGPLRVSATIPYIVVRGSGAIVGDGEDDVDDIDNVPVGDRNRQGWGDLRLTARYRLSKVAQSGFEVDLMGQMKVPTASREKRLGTGEVDYVVGAKLSRDLGRLEPFVSAQYRINGDRPGFNYRNTMATSVGAGFRLSRRTSASLSYDYAQSRIQRGSGFHSLDAGVSTRLSSRVSVRGSAAIGLSDKGTDLQLGSRITWRAF